ncbi:MAG: MATE family efflux transporter [Pseudomonadota bacterium]|nr:MATE family efflux transporter [Pseudomonadota bacterium]
MIFPEKDRIDRIFLLALPLIGGMLSQTILNLVDTAMVSRLPNSDAALAAVGFGGFILFTSQAIILGLSTGVQACASRRLGQERDRETAHFLNAALMIILVIAPLITLLVFFSSPSFYPYVNQDPDVISEGIPYLQIRSLGIIFVSSNFAFRGFWNAVDMTRVYLKTMVCMHGANIILNYILIFGKFGAPELGVEGAAYASLLSLAFGCLLYFYHAGKLAGNLGFLNQLPKFPDILTLIKLSLPNGFQQLFFSTGFLATFWIIGKIGTPEVAAANVLINLMLVAMLPSMAMGLSAATLVGQSLGRNNIRDAELWGWDVAKITSTALGLFGILLALFPEIIVSSIYTLSPQTTELTILPLRIVGVFMGFEALGTVLQSALLGAGDTRRVMTISIINQWVLFLPAAYWVGPVLGYGLTGVWLLQSVYRVWQTGIFLLLWKNREWAKVTI